MGDVFYRGAVRANMLTPKLASLLNTLVAQRHGPHWKPHRE